MASRGRRRFLQWGLAGAAAAWRGGASRAGEKPPEGRVAEDKAVAGKLPEGKMPMRRLGRTGVDVSLVGLADVETAQAVDEQTATRIIHAAIDHGINFMDNCWDYNDGKSHLWMGRALGGGYRKRAFLMTKIDGRTRSAAAAQIDQSLRDLGTDAIDLMQVHEVIRGTDPDRVFGPDGAMEAIVAAKKAGKIRFIGFTGHKSPRIHLKMLDVAAAHHFPFDTVQMPVNVMDAHRDSFERLVMPAATTAGVAVLAMKPLGSGVFFKSGPLALKRVSAVECLRYSMGSAASVVITGCQSMRDLAQALEAAYKAPAMNEEERKVVLARTAPAGTDGQWEKYKVSDMFDGTARNPHWLESAKL